MPSGSVSCIAIENGNENHLLVTYFNYGVTSVWETTDGGSNWTNVEGDLPDMPVRWCMFDPTNSDRALLATEVGVWTTNDLNGSSTDWDPSVSGLANVRVDMLQTRTSDNLVLAGTHGRGLFTTDAFSSARAQFTADKTTWLINRSIQFTDGSLQATSWSWNFGDGNTSTEQNPEHVYASTGTYTVALTVNGSASTETKTNYITILDNPAIPYSQDFNSNNGAFYAHSISEDENYWEWGAGTNSKSNYKPSNGLETLEGAASWITNLTGNHGTNTVYALDSPPFNLEGGTGSYTLDFKYRMLANGTDGTGSNDAGFHVQYSTDGGDSWTILGSSSDSDWYTNSSIAGLNGSAGFWKGSGTWTTIFNPSYDISSLIGNSDVRFRFVFGASNNQWDGVQFDNFQIQGNAISTIAQPTALQAGTVTSNSANLSWTGTSGEFRVVRTGTAFASSPTSGTLVYEGSSTSTTAGSLTENNTVYFSVFGKATGSNGYSSNSKEVAVTISTSNTVSASIPANQTGSFVFGNTGADVTITTNQDGDGGSLQITRYNSGPSGNNTISGSATAPDETQVTPNAISTDRYWAITTALTGSNAYDVSLDISDVGGVSDMDKLVILKRDESGWSPVNTSRSGNVLTASVTSFSDFGIGSNSTDNSLPVTLSEFEAEIHSDVIILNWKTESEINNLLFNVLKSQDNNRYYKIGEVPGHGSSSSGFDYSFSDTEISIGSKYFYTLNSIDYDGTPHNYDTLVVDLSSGEFDPLLPTSYALYQNHPNPFNPSTTITFDVPEDSELSITVFDIMGREVAKLVNGSVVSGRNQVVWNGKNHWDEDMSSGIYFAKMVSGDFSKSIKMVLKK